MSGFDHLDLIWLLERNLAVIYVHGEAPEEFAAAAIILKGADGTDQFIPYDGYIEGAPIVFSIGRDEVYSIRVIGFASSIEPVELASWTLDQDLISSQAQKELDMSVLGFGERTRDWQGESQIEMGVNRLDYGLQGAVDYSDLLSSYLMDSRGLEDETFTSLFVTAMPYQNISDGDMAVGPALHLRPMHHFHFGFSVQCRSVLVEDDDEAGDLYSPSSSPIEGAAILSRHGGFETREVPELIINAGASRDSLEFILANGYQVHWRRQLENWSGEEKQGEVGSPGFLATSGFGQENLSSVSDAPFVMEPYSERSHLLQHEGQHFLRFDVEEAIIGDVVGVVFSSEEATLDIDLHMDGELKYQLKSVTSLLFIFMGEDGFVPLTNDILNLPENLGLTARLQDHIDKGLQSTRSASSLKAERARAALSLLERDQILQEIVETEALQDVAAEGPFGPELMVFRDHILRVAQSADMAHWMVDLKKAKRGLRRGKLTDILRFDMFCKAPQLAHALVFNHKFRQKFQTKPIDPHSFQMPVLEYLMSKLYSDPVIDWAMRLKGESQAILWHLILKRPDMVDQLYDLKLEPDVALNPFDEQVLSHVETALQDSHQINVDLIEKKVIPLFHSMGEDERVKDLTEFAHALNYGAEGKALRLGELSVCLAAVERASSQWAEWCETATEIFQPLVDPLVLELPDFDRDVEFISLKKPQDFHQKIGHLAERLVKEQELPEDLLTRGLEFIQTIDIELLLTEIEHKLDLSLKYQRDLAVGVGSVFDEFDVTPKDLEIIQSIDADVWPALGKFPASFADPLKKRQRSQKSSFDKLIKNFAQKAHPNDQLFHQTLKDALMDLESALPLLHWLEVGEEMENRVKQAQNRLNKALLKVNPASVKLRRSKVISSAVRDIVAAERMGPQGWPNLAQSLEVIETELPKEQL